MLIKLVTMEIMTSVILTQLNGLEATDWIMVFIFLKELRPQRKAAVLGWKAEDLELPLGWGQRAGRRHGAGIPGAEAAGGRPEWAER